GVEPAHVAEFDWKRVGDRAEREKLGVRVRTEQDHAGVACSAKMRSMRARRSVSDHSEQSSHLNADSVWYHRQHACRCQTQRDPTATTSPAPRNSGLPASMNSTSRSRISSCRSA